MLVLKNFYSQYWNESFKRDPDGRLHFGLRKSLVGDGEGKSLKKGFIEKSERRTKHPTYIWGVF